MSDILLTMVDPCLVYLQGVVYMNVLTTYVPSLVKKIGNQDANKRIGFFVRRFNTR